MRHPARNPDTPPPPAEARCESCNHGRSFVSGYCYTSRCECCGKTGPLALTVPLPGTVRHDAEIRRFALAGGWRLAVGPWNGCDWRVTLTHVMPYLCLNGVGDSRREAFAQLRRRLADRDFPLRQSFPLRQESQSARLPDVPPVHRGNPAEEIRRLYLELAQERNLRLAAEARLTRLEHDDRRERLPT